MKIYTVYGIPSVDFLCGIWESIAVAHFANKADAEQYAAMLEKEYQKAYARNFEPEVEHVEGIDYEFEEAVYVYKDTYVAETDIIMGLMAVSGILVPVYEENK